jgi:myo-inositol-1(or 4)-monophosphatase
VFLGEIDRLLFGRVDHRTFGVLTPGADQREDFVALIGRVMAEGAGVRCGGSGTLGLVETAVGRLDGYVELHINAWDACGALAIAREAGCWTNDFDSGAWLTEGNPICFAAPALGARLAALMQGEQLDPARL